MQLQADSIRSRLAEIGFAIPQAQVTTFDYLPVTFHGHTAYLAGQIPKHGNEVLHQGRVGQAVSFEQAQEAVRVATGQALAWIEATCGGLENVERILRMEFFVAVEDNFKKISELADEASRILAIAFGDDGRHARSVLGVNRLPRHAPVLIQLTFTLKQPARNSSGDN